jgi:hypothetical protein
VYRVTAGAEPASSALSKPAGISTAARILLSEMRPFQSAEAGSILNLPDFSSSPLTLGESAPPTIITLGISSRALVMTMAVTFPNPIMIRGMTNVGMTIVDMRVLRSRSRSRSSLA